MNLRVMVPPASPFESLALRLAGEGPAWLRAARRAAWHRASELGLPRADAEVWRYSDLARLDVEPYRAPADDAALPSPEEVIGVRTLSGRLETRGAGAGRAWLSDEARRAGVLLCDLGAAAAEHEDLVRERLGKLAGADDVFLARNLALHQAGSFLYVPRGVELTSPVALVSGHGAGGTAQHLRHLVVVEPGARLVLDELSVSAAPSTPSLSHEVVELHVGDGAWVGWLHWQALAGRAGQSGFRRAVLGRGAHLESLAVTLGGEYSRSWLEVSLAGVDARSDLLGIAFPTGQERVEQWTVQEHVAPRTTSDLLYRAALADQARSLYYGTIRVHPGASRTDAYQANRNLVLSSGARADTNPQLEIGNNDVRCTHGATVGPLDEEQVFYLMSRGLPRARAERLLVSGFFADVLRRSAWSGIGGALERALRRRIEGQPS